MTFDQAAVFTILAATLGLFIWGGWRHDLVALAALCAVALLGLVPDERLFAGFGHPAVITVFAVLVVSHGLKKCGAAAEIARRMRPAFSTERAHVGSLTGAVTAFSAFMNNIGALALFMPVALASASERGRNPSILLMPLAFGSLLGGLVTLIGTPPNLIVSAFRAQSMGEPYRMFDFTWVGLPVAVAGVVFIALIGWRLIPTKRRKTNAQSALFTLDGYLIEMRVAKDSPLVGRRLRDAELLYAPGVSPLGVIRNSESLPAVGYRVVAAEDVLILRVDPDMLPEIASRYKLTTVREDRGGLRLDDITWKDAALLEAVIRPESRLIGRSARAPNRRFGPDFSVLAVRRGGERLAKRLRDIKLQANDVILIQGEAQSIAELTDVLGLLPLAERGLNILQPAKTTALTIGVFAAAILLIALGLVNVAVGFLLVVLVYAIFGVLSPRELYNEVDWSIIVLLGGMFPLGEAMQNTGADKLIADGLVATTQGWPLWALVAAMLVVTTVLSNVINNAATALLAAPIAVAVANQLGVGPDALLMATAIGASAAFMTPIAHQSNVLVMAPGGYEFSDYWRMGLPLQIVVAIVAVPMIMLFWG